MSRLRHGRIAAATAEPRNVTAITSVASSGEGANFVLYAYSAAIPIDGTSISSSAMSGTPLRSTFATPSGSTRSNAAAKTTRVEDRNTVPTQPKNHIDRMAMRTNWRNPPGRNDAAKRPGYGHTPVGIVPAQNALLAAW